MRLPSKMTIQEINKVVEQTIIEMGLEECANTKIGNWHLRGIRLLVMVKRRDLALALRF